MNVYLAEPAPLSPLAFTQDETRKFIRVLAERKERNRDCCHELFFSVFFDGTGNNEEIDRPKNKQSNVARLRRVFPPNREDDGFFAVYAPGVGTKFDDIGDSGEGDDLVWGETDRRRGLAFAEKGEARIVWALLRVLDRIHFHIARAPLLTTDQMRKLSNDLTEANAPLWLKVLNPGMAAATQWTHKRILIDHRRNEVLVDLCRQVERKIKEVKRRRPDPRVLGIRLSVFGFSRGAAQARVFSNWFLQMCHAASGRNSLAGLPVDFDFLGLFDTVASVGLANSAIVADGHMEWADAATNLRIPGEVKQCLHLVSAHELRRSFPLDSVAVGRGLPGNCREIVYPGVHSDVGGGYLPCEQGRGTDAAGDDLLSRVPLAHMYREARLANVPLDVNGKGVTQAAGAALAVADATREAFNAYLSACQVRSGTLAEILDEQTRLYVRWRRLRLDSMGSLASVQRALAQDRTDLLEANKELAEEVRLLESPVATAHLRVVEPVAVTLIKLRRRINDTLEKRGVDPGHYEEWKRLQPDWNRPGHLPAEVSRLFEEWVHDSRAWFKPFGDDDHIWEKKQRARMQRLEQEQQVLERLSPPNRVQPKQASRNNAPSPTWERLSGSESAERRELEEWKKTGQLPTQPTGREPFTMGGGYLRYRRVYYGSDARIVAMGVPEDHSAVA